VSTVEPFLIDEKKITAKHVAFWIEKRLAAQGILPVWKKDEEENTAAKYFSLILLGRLQNKSM
jgi:Protein of unknown function (DUF2996)